MKLCTQFNQFENANKEKSENRRECPFKGKGRGMFFLFKYPLTGCGGFIPHATQMSFYRTNNRILSRVHSHNFAIGPATIVIGVKPLAISRVALASERPFARAYCEQMRLTRTIVFLVAFVLQQLLHL